MQEAEDVEPEEALSRLRDVGDEGLGVALLEWRCCVAAAKLEVSSWLGVVGPEEDRRNGKGH